MALYPSGPALEAPSGGQTRAVTMRQQIHISLLLAAVTAAQAGAAEAPKPGSCPNALDPLPRSVTQVVDRIVREIRPEFRKKLLVTKRQDLVQFQHDWGAGIRSSLCLLAGNNDQLIRSACGGELCHPEDASMVIMEAVWDRLQRVKRVVPTYGHDGEPTEEAHAHPVPRAANGEGTAASTEALSYLQGECPVSRGTQSNDALQAAMPFEGRFVFSPDGPGFVDQDGALGIKFLWMRRRPGSLLVGGRRLDGDAGPARAYMSGGYGRKGFMPIYLIFPTPGCWEITGRIGEESLSFVVHVEKVGDGPNWRFDGLPEGWYQTTL
jgi:hypothetical protein